MDDGYEPLEDRYKRKKKKGKKKNLSRAQGPSRVQDPRPGAAPISNAQPELYNSADFPNWFPVPHGAAQAALHKVDRSVARQNLVGQGAYPARQEYITATRLYRVPRTHFLSNTSFEDASKGRGGEQEKRQAAEVRVSRLLFTIVQIWPYLVRKINQADLSPDAEERGLHPGRPA